MMKINFLILIAISVMFIGCNDNSKTNVIDDKTQISRDVIPSPTINDESLKPPEIPAI